MSLNAKGVNNNFYGKYHTKDSKQKMRLARLGKSPANKGTSLSEEAKLAITMQRSCSIRFRWQYYKHI